jgi:hypothetical protein
MDNARNRQGSPDYFAGAGRRHLGFTDADERKADLVRREASGVGSSAREPPREEN